MTEQLIQELEALLLSYQEKSLALLRQGPKVYNQQCPELDRWFAERLAQLSHDKKEAQAW